MYLATAFNFWAPEAQGTNQGSTRGGEHNVIGSNLDLNICFVLIVNKFFEAGAFWRFVMTSLVTVGSVFIAGSALVLFSQALGLGLFSGEGGLRVIVVALLASAWAMLGIAAMAVLLGMPIKLQERTGTETPPAGKAAPVNDSEQ